MCCSCFRWHSCCWRRRLASAQSVSKRQKQTPLVLKPDAPGLAKNHRLILKDGSYQLVRQYKIVGDRVRYLSLERGDWEEMPVELVDWDATRKWERDHATPTGEEPSPAMKEAADIDKEETDERNLQKARMPEVAKGLELPDEDGVFALDTFQGTPELVELTPVDLNMNAKTRHGVSTLNPLAASKGQPRTRRASTPRFTCMSTIRPSISRSTSATMTSLSFPMPSPSTPAAQTRSTTASTARTQPSRASRLSAWTSAGPYASSAPSA